MGTIQVDFYLEWWKPLMVASGAWLDLLTLLTMDPSQKTQE
jgi:hypothetical protein